MVETAVQMSIEVAEMPDVIDTVAEGQVLATTKLVNWQYDECLQMLRSMESLIEGYPEFNFSKAMTFASEARWAIWKAFSESSERDLP